MKIGHLLSKKTQWSCSKVQMGERGSSHKKHKKSISKTEARVSSRIFFTPPTKLKHQHRPRQSHKIDLVLTWSQTHVAKTTTPIRSPIRVGKELVCADVTAQIENDSVCSARER